MKYFFSFKLHLQFKPNLDRNEQNKFNVNTRILDDTFDLIDRFCLLPLIRVSLNLLENLQVIFVPAFTFFSKFKS